MKRVRYKVYLTTGAILALEMLASDTTVGLSDICKPMKAGEWPIWMMDKVEAGINPGQVTHVTAEEIEE